MSKNSNVQLSAWVLRTPSPFRALTIITTLHYALLLFIILFPYMNCRLTMIITMLFGFPLTQCHIGVKLWTVAYNDTNTVEQKFVEASTDSNTESVASHVPGQSQLFNNVGEK